MPRKHREIPWLEWADNGYAYVYWYDKANSRTARKSLDTKDPVEAQKHYAAFLSEGHEIYTDTSGLTVHHALDFYKNEHVAENVVDTYRQEQAIKLLKAY